MTTPNMASLQKSLQNCSLTHQQSDGGTATIGGDSPENSSDEVADPILELNSEVALPSYWEQCLDLETGEIYFINWRTGMKTKDDPRFEYSSEDDSSSYDSDGSSFSESSSTDPPDDPENGEVSEPNLDFNNVLVVVGCKMCLMYYMVPRKLDICPKCCCPQLLHFD